MFPSRLQISRTHFFIQQQGVSMAFLLFAIVIVSLLAAALIRLNAHGNSAMAQQFVSTRAFFAAESGANLQALAIFPVVGVAGVCVDTDFTFNNQGLNDCVAVTTCRAITINSINYYQVSSQGQCNTGNPLQATRTIEIRLKQIN
jgi:MSHA biogenesis protein MshP